jgi:hypothetical protein
MSLGNPSSLPPLFFLSLFFLILHWRRFFSPVSLPLSGSFGWCKQASWRHGWAVADRPGAGAQLAHRGARAAAGSGAGAPEAGRRQRGSRSGGRSAWLGSGCGSRASSGQAVPGLGDSCGSVRLARRASSARGRRRRAAAVQGGAG